MTWQLGPGDRVGIVGANGSGKTSLLRLLGGSVTPESGRVVQGKTVQLAHLSQELVELDPTRRVLESVEEIRSGSPSASGSFTAGQLLERLGFRGDAQWTPVGDLSGGERRRLQLLRLLMGEPNVLLLDEPTNDLDIETLTELEDLLDGWPGTLVVVSHDRYFLERVTDHIVALLGDRSAADAARRGRRVPRAPLRERWLPPRRRPPPARPPRPRSGGPAERSGRRAGLEGAQGARPAGAPGSDKLGRREAELHDLLAAHAADYERLLSFNTELTSVRSEQEKIEEQWLLLADDLDA